MAMNSGVEVELTYVLRTPEESAAYLSAPTLGPFAAAGASRPRQYEDRYVDTVDGALARAGFAARLRRGPKGTLLTVKSTATSGGAMQRRTELEGPADVSLDAAAWPSSSARSLVLELCGDAPLGEIVTIRQLRRTRDLRSESARAELSVDEVEVVVGGEVIDRFTELEIEHRDGDEASLHELAAELAGAPELRAAGRSKLQRALEAAGLRDGRTVAPPSTGPDGDEPATAEGAPALAGATIEEPIDGAEPARSAPPETGPAAPAPPPKTPGVLAEDSVAEAGRKVLRFHYARLRLREPGTRSGKDSEDLHGMRVATRRMRAAWRVFGDGFRPRRTAHLRSRLRVLGTRLGAVRDLDVLIEALEDFGKQLEPEERQALAPLAAAWDEQRQAARRLLIRELDSDDHRRLIDEYDLFVKTEGEAAIELSSPTEPARVRERAASRIWDAYEHLRAYERVLPWADVPTLHELRIAAKWLRYTLEFFRETLGPDAPALIGKVVAIQDHLGILHDADVTASLVRTFLVENAGRLDAIETRAIGRYLRTKEQELTRLRRSFGRTWRPVASVSFRRGLGRAVAAL